MSEKRIISFDEVIEISDKFDDIYSLKNYFKSLPELTLDDVMGIRELKTMTEKEYDEFYIRWGHYIKSDIIKYSEMIKWFIEKGFKI